MFFACCWAFRREAIIASLAVPTFRYSNLIANVILLPNFAFYKGGGCDQARAGLDN